MAPKRGKATETAVDTAPTTRGKRTSARQKDASLANEVNGTGSSKKRKTTSDKSDNPEEKKTRKRTKAVNSVTTNDDDVAASDKKVSMKSRDAPLNGPNQLFDAYADADDRENMGAEGFERLCGDANIPMDGARPLLLAWQLQSKELGTFSRTEWVKGLEELGVGDLETLATVLVDLEELIIKRTPAPPKPTTKSVSKGIKSKSAPPAIDRYKKDRYWRYADKVETSFSEFYNFCFALVKKEGSRNIDMEYACAFWSVILAPRYPIVSEIIEFINEKGTYKGVNKDLWAMMYEFCQTIKPSLEGYDSEGAWPTLLDDFVEWKKAKAGAGSSG